MSSPSIPWKLALAALLLCGPAFGQDQAMDDTVAMVERAIAQTSSMTAKFTQTVESKRFGAARQASGTMAIKKPAMMRWEYVQPDGLLIVADGKRLWYYDKPANTLSSEPLEGYMGPRSPILFLTGREPLTAVFDATVVKGPQENDSTINLKLIPKGQTQGIKAALLKVEPGSFIIKGMVIVDYLGGKNTISFSDVASPPLEDSMFEFTAPQGVNVQPAARAPGL